MHIVFLDFSTADWIPAYVVSHDENSISYIHPVCYSWVRLLNKEEQLKDIKVSKIMLPLERLIYEKRKCHFYEPAFLYDFPINERAFVELNTLTSFFTKVTLTKNNTKINFDSLERAISMTHFLFQDKDVLKNAVSYLLTRYNAKNERLRLLKYPMIMEYLQNNESK